jgi:hypothetical protein
VGLGSHRVGGHALKSVTDGVSGCFSSIGTLCFIQNVADVRRHGIETYRQDERNVLVGATEREQPQNLDFPGSQVIRICDTRVANVSGCCEKAVGDAVRSANLPQLTLAYLRTHTPQEAAAHGIPVVLAAK